MTINFTDFGLTSAIDPTDPTKVTADAQLRVSAQADSLGLIADYTQSTNANKPRWSRSDNRENLVQYSEGAFNNTTYWTKASVTIADAAITVGSLSMSTITASAASAAHGLYSVTGVNPTTIVGQSYEQSWLAKMGTHRYVQVAPFAGPFATTYFNFDLQDGVVGTNGGGGITGGIEVYDAANGVYRIWVRATGIGTTFTGGLLYLVPSASATRLQSWVAAGTETIHVARCHYRNILTDPTYLPTTDYPQYAGVNGQKWLVLNGAQWVSTTSTFGDIVANNSKLFYVPAVSFLFDATTRTLVGDGVPNSGIFTTSTPRFIIRNDDGAADAANNGVNQVVGVPYIVRGRQTGGNLYLAIDSGAGFVEGAPVASGNTTTMANIVRIGARTDGSAGFYGKIGGIFTANTGIPKPNFENLLREYYFARSQLIWDPYLAELVLKRPTVIG
jgi:hypothetical protein